MNIESLLTSAITWAFGQHCNELDSFKVSRDDLKHFAEHIVYTIEESNNKRQISILTDELSSRISPIHRELLDKKVQDWERDRDPDVWKIGFRDALVEFRSYINSPNYKERLSKEN